MRDLKRANAKLPAYKQFIEAGIEVFTPMHTVLKTIKGKQKKVTQPFIRDLLFVHDSRTVIDPIVELTPTLQYRFERGKGYMVPMTVRDEDMKKFLLAVSSTRSAVYMLPEEMNPKMIGRTIRIAGGPLEGCTGKLVSIKGSRAKRLLVEIPGILAACVEVEARYVEIL
ncbi:MAG: UpxY family transcription antiterminator [Bacteroidia bacterium]|nr:UpxY family transcription antiterminator [Bacteroidia bacterium]